jgi:hypothetical protein
MPNFLHILLRILAGIAGALLLYVAFFLYEDEEARIQNRLEQIWQKINALQSSAMSEEAAFLQEVTRTTSEILDRLLGHQLLSLQSIAVSMAFSLGSFFVCVGFFYAQAEPKISFSSRVILYPELLAPILFILGSLPSLVGGRHSVFKHLRLVAQSKLYFIGLIIYVISLPSIPFQGLWIAIYPRVGVVTAVSSTAAPSVQAGKAL